MPVDHQPNELEPSVERILGAQRSRKRGTFAIVALFLVAFAAAAYVWLNYDGITQVVSSAAQPATAQPVAGHRETVPLEDFQTFQKQTTDSLTSVNQNLAAQKADLQRLSEQVSALAARLEAMQSAVSTAPPQQTVPARSPAPAERKKPSAPKAGPISVGGAPLPPNPTDGH